MVRPALVDRLALLLGAVLLVGGIAWVHVPAAVGTAGALLMAGVIWRKA